MSEKKIFLIIGLVTLLLVGGGIWLSTKSGQTVNVTAAPGAKAKLEKTSQDWGEIKMGDGTVEARFTVKNEGDQPLKLFNGTTSCACTKAKIVTKIGESGYFGMHTKSKQISEIGPGESGEVVAIFDPAFHGPSGVGPINRTVTVATNDPDNPELSFAMMGTVVK